MTRHETGLTGGDGGADGGEDEEEGGQELGEVRPERRRREAVLQVSADVVGRHGGSSLERSVFARIVQCSVKFYSEGRPKGPRP
jgi:hypothetical protein